MRALLKPQNAIPVVIIAAVAAMVAYANVRDVRGSRAPYTSAPPIGVPGAPDTSRAGLERRIADMRARLEKHPDDAGASLLLADALLRQARVTGNPGLSVSAEQVLKTVLRDDPGSYDAKRMLGALYLSQHRFREAVGVGEQNRDARPYDPVNYGVIGDAHLELGEYDEAFAAFDRMMALRPGAASYARVAYARELRGDLSGALHSMKLAVDATAPTDPEGLAWAQSQVGDLHLQLNQVHEAKSAFTAASHAFPGHPFAIAGYSRAIAREGDVAGALELLRGLAARSPTPDIHAQMGDLLVRLDRRDEAERQFALAEAAWQSDAPEPRSLARFLAEHDRRIPDAVKIAEAAARERQDIFTEDALAWSYFKAGRIEDARAAIRRALRTGTRDATIREHARAIESAPSAVAAR